METNDPLISQMVKITNRDTKGTLVTPLPSSVVWITKCAHVINRERNRCMQADRWYFAVTGTLWAARLLTRIVTKFLQQRNDTRLLSFQTQ